MVHAVHNLRALRRWEGLVCFMVSLLAACGATPTATPSTPFADLDMHAPFVYNTLAWSPDGSLVAAATLDAAIHLWHSDGSAATTITKSGMDRVDTLAWSPDGNLLAAGAAQAVYLWRRDGTLVTRLDAYYGTLAWSPDSHTLATAADDHSIRLWRPDGTALRTLVGHSRVVMSLAWSPDGSRLASGGDDSTVRLWRTDGTALTTMTQSGSVNRLAWSLDSHTLATQTTTHALQLWSADGNLLKSLTQAGQNLFPTQVQWAGDGNTLAAINTDGKVQLWRNDGTAVATLAQSTINGLLAWTPDGQTLVVPSDFDNILHLWHKDGTAIGTITGPHQTIQAIAVSPDSKTLAVSANDNHFRLWHLTN